MKKDNVVIKGLTSEDYIEILDEKKEKIVEFKTLQNECYSNIVSQKEYLKSLRDELRGTKSKIKICKAGLRKEKRKLSRTNQYLSQQIQYINNLNNAFIEEGKNMKTR